MSAGCGSRISPRPSVSTMTWRLRPFTFLPASKPRGPPLSVVLTDWLSSTAALGEASRPTRSRSAMTRRWFMVSNKPVSRHCPNQRYTVVLGGKSLEQSPSPPAPQHVEDRVHHLAQRPFSWPPPLVRFGHERLDQSPLRIGQIRFVTQPVAAMLPPSGRGPHRVSK